MTSKLPSKTTLRPERSRRGRPAGSVTLTKDMEATILSYVRGGAYDHVAAEAAGISARTFRDWMARGEARHPTRPPTPRLRAFAEGVRKARAEARLGAEVRVYRDNPTYWLSHAARTTAEREGWTDPERGRSITGTDADVELHGGPDDGELGRLLAVMVASGDIALPPCSHSRCRCSCHRRKGS